MDCCSSSNYPDSMNGNFCYPYSPSMLRSASPYPMAGPGMANSGRYGATDYRSSSLGYYHGAMSYEGYDKYCGGYGPPAAFGASYYGAYSSSYRDFGGYGHYSPSPYARGGAGPGSLGASPYGGSSSSGGYLYPGRHYSASFGPRESYYHAQRDHHHHHQQPYSSFTSYTHLAPYRNGAGPGTHEHPGAKSLHHSQPPPPQQSYPPPHGFPVGHSDRGPGEGGTPSSDGLPSSSPSAALFTAQNGYSSPASDYALPSAYGSGGSPQHPPSGQQEPTAADDAHKDTARTAATPTPTTAAMRGATADFPLGTKDARMRKPKERKLHRTYGTGTGSGRVSRPTSPSQAGGAAAVATRMKSLDALTNLCWPEDEQFPGRIRKYSAANGLKPKDLANNRKENNELESNGTASPGRGTARRTKKPTSGSKLSKEAKSGYEARENLPTGGAPTTPLENKNVTPLPGFQQAFGSTEIGKFSEVFFNASPTPAENSPPHHHGQQPQPQQLPGQPQQQPQQQPGQQPRQGPIQQLMMESLSAYESDVDTLSPQPWDPATPGTGESYDGVGNGGYNLQIGTTFHPSYYESSSYSDHAVDSPLGSYFSEMTCNEYVN